MTTYPEIKPSKTELKATICTLQTEIETLTKKLKDQTLYTEMYYKSASNHETTINKVHTVLDLLASPPPRRFTPQNGYEQELDLLTRFTIYLSQK